VAFRRQQRKTIMSDTLLSHALPLPQEPDAPAVDAHHLQRAHKRYLTVYGVLIVGTVLTVAMYYVHFDELWQTVGVALAIAAVKASFVAAIFMHLWHGQRDIYRIMFFTFVFAAVLLGLTISSVYSLPGSGHYLR
jgi:caa(3)-type oxidase subunit IV